MAARKLNPTTLSALLGNWRGPFEVDASDDPVGPGRRPLPGAVDRPAYRALAETVAMLVLDGRIPLGSALPSERQLADALGLSRTTITAAYTELREQGFLHSQQGARSVVTAPGAGSPTALGTAAQPPSRGAAPDVAYQQGVSIAWATHGASEVIDLNYAAVPALEGVVAQAYQVALQGLPRHLPTVGFSPRGLLELREVVAASYRDRGLPTGADQILVTSGAQHAVGLVLGALCSPGERVLVEQPTYPHALDAIRRVGARPLPVPLHTHGPGPHGWDVGALDLAIRQGAPRLAYLIVDHQNPTGLCLSEHARRQLGEVIRSTRSVVVNDETLTDIWLDGPPPPPLASYVRGPGRTEGSVITIGSLSKSFWGGMRVGWIRADRATIDAIAQTRFAVDLGTPVVEQLAAAHLLAQPQSVQEPRRRQLRTQRDALLEALRDELPDWRAQSSPGGLCLWVRMPQPVSTALAAAARQHGLHITAGSRFSAEGTLERFLRVPYTQPAPVLREAVRRLALTYYAIADAAPTPELETVL